MVWQLPQISLSLLVLVWYKMTRQIVESLTVSGGIAENSRVYIIRMKGKQAFSLGELIFVSDKYDTEKRITTIKHEYGHAIQSVKWGWLYLIVIGIPSLLITGVAPGVAKKCYFETNAEKLVKDIELIII